MELCKSLCAGICLLFTSGLLQASTLNSGDIQFVGYQADNPDTFAFVSWTELDASTQITFTDNGWLADGGFRSGEGELFWTAGQAIAAGSLVIIGDSVSVGSVTGSLGLSSSGDQLFAIDGMSGDLITGIQMNGAWDVDATSAGTSALPPDISADLLNFFISPERDNAVYTGPFSGLDINVYRQTIDDPANWVSSNASVDFSGLRDFSIPVETGRAAVSSPKTLVLLLSGLLLLGWVSGKRQLFAGNRLACFSVSCN
ncbi:MAG: hypothetical protein PVG66_14750 [Chromatiales bacterium]|jgi:hypothetical protein